MQPTTPDPDLPHRLLRRHGWLTVGSAAAPPEPGNWLDAPLVIPAQVRAARTHDSHALRTLFAPSLIGHAGQFDDAGILRIAPEVFWVYASIYQRRFRAGRPVSDEDVRTLAIAVNAASAIASAPSAVLPELMAQVRSRLGHELCARLCSSAPLNGGQAGPHITFLHAHAHDRPLPEPKYTHPLRRALAELIAAPGDREAGPLLVSLFRRFFDFRTSLFRQESGHNGSAAGGALFISALVPLAIAINCRRNGVRLHPPPETAPRPGLPDPGASMVIRAGLELAERLRTPSHLPGSLDPQRADGFPLALERELLRPALAEAMAREGFTVRLLDAAAGAPCILTIRHDVDRPMPETQLEQILMWEESLGIRSSWYFKSETYQRPLADRIIATGSEVGYHAASIENGDGGFAELLRRNHGGHCVGCTFHGGPGTTFWRGRASIEHAARLGFDYAEMPAEWFGQPYEWPTANRPIMLTPPSVKFDAYPDWVAGQMQLACEIRGHAIIENHPDLFSPPFQDFVEGWLARGAACRTVAGHVSHCRAREHATLTPIEADDRRGMLLRIDCETPCIIEIALDAPQFTFADPQFAGEIARITHAGGRSEIPLMRCASAASHASSSR